MEKNLLLCRKKYFLGFMIFLFIEIFIALYVRDNFIRPYLGDILVVVVIYFFVKSIYPYKIKNLPLYIFLFSTMTEFLQYINIVEILGLSDYSFFRILIGTVFDVKDIICYGIGCIIIGIFQKKFSL